MTSFTTELLRLQCTSDELIYSAFENGLLVGHLYMELCRYPPTFAQDMWKIVRTYATMDETTKRKAEQGAMYKKGPEDRSHETSG